MYDGSAPPQTVKLKCENHLMKSVLDRFGMDVKTAVLDADHFTAAVEISASPTFYGWVFTFGGGIEIVSPECVAEEYRAAALRAAQK
jgi:predicted DNA-binding transcriptional regulator YafY